MSDLILKDTLVIPCKGEKCEFSFLSPQHIHARLIYDGKDRCQVEPYPFCINCQYNPELIKIPLLTFSENKVKLLKLYYCDNHFNKNEKFLVNVDFHEEEDEIPIIDTASPNSVRKEDILPLMLPKYINWISVKDGFPHNDRIILSYRGRGRMKCCTDMYLHDEKIFASSRVEHVNPVLYWADVNFPEQS